MSSTRKKIISFISLLLILSFSFFVSCSRKNAEQRFNEKLQRIDSYILEGRSSKALRKLGRLERKAKTYKNYASIVKRQLKLNAVPEAIFFLQKGLKKKPSSAELSAMLVSILIENNRAVEAIPYCENLRNTRYAGLAAEACVMTDIEFNTFDSDFSLLKSAYDLTKNQIFLKNAALNLASRGRLKEAANMRELLDRETAPEHPFFWSCLAYDIGRFAPIFDDLFFSLNYADRVGGEGKPADLARRHLMLAADAAFGQGDSDRSRAFWLAAADRSPKKNPVVFYDLALTAPDERERSDMLIECLDLFPNYYPVVAQYTREFMSLREQADSDDITEYLEDRGFYSMKMEHLYFSSPNMTYKPEYLFDRAMQGEDFDPRFILEKFRYEQFEDGTPSANSRGMGKIWKMLEKRGDSPKIREYAKWYFSKNRDFNACFSVADIENRSQDAFYKGLAASLEGNYNDALAYFATSSMNPDNAFAAKANTAQIYYLQGEIADSIEAFSLAVSMCNDDKEKSLLQYQMATVLAERKAIDRAITSLEYALDLNPDNYEAEILLKRLKQAK